MKYYHTGIAACMILLAFMEIVPAHAKRVALVIGNDQYEHLGVLSNPVKDASSLTLLNCWIE